jgi:hypothetical protein
MKGNKLLQIGLIFALSWIIVRLALFQFRFEYRWELGIALNLLVLPVVVLLGLQGYKKRVAKNVQQTFFTDFKAAMRPAALYSLIIAGFTLINYARIDREFIQDIRNDRVELIEENIKDAGGWDKYKRTIGKQGELDPEQMTEKDFLTQKRSEIETVISPFTASSATLLALMFLSFVYSLFITILYRKVLVKYT